jgi:uncharacterized repeat protein (TIGR01451 family)
MTIFKRLCLLLPLLLLLIPASVQAAVPAAPGWAIESFAAPTNFSTVDNATCETQLAAAHGLPLCDSYTVTATNAGSVATQQGGEVSLTDTLPAGLTVPAGGVRLIWPGVARILGEMGERVEMNVLPVVKEVGELFPKAGGCSISTTLPITIHCSVVFSEFDKVAEEFGLCTGSACSVNSVLPDEAVKLETFVTVNEPSASGVLENAAAVSGGGAPRVSTDPTTSPPNSVGEQTPGFGPSSFDFDVVGNDGAFDTQAGDHPYELTANINLNNDIRNGPEQFEREDTSVQDAKDIVVDLPLGFVGSILAAPQCTFAQLSSRIRAGVSGCPLDTVVGHILVRPSTSAGVEGPIYNMVPERGVPAEFAYVDKIGGAHVFYVHVVPTSRGYVLQTINPDIPEIDLDHIVVSFYGDPAVRDGSGNAQIPYFTNPTTCGNGPMLASIYMDSWENPAKLNADGTPTNLEEAQWVKMTSESPPMTGCNALQFTPELGAQPTTHESDKPSGLEFEIKQPQPEEAGTLAASTLNNATVVLPEGMTVDPSAGDGLQACSEAQIGWEQNAPGSLKFNANPEGCPEASKIGSLELATPLIPNKLEGALYLASQDENPFHTLLAAYIVVDDPITGVLIKLAGKVEPNPYTGRLTATFEQNPQLPFSDLKLHFFGGPRASLATPESCGSFTTSSVLEPWSAPDSGPSAMPFDAFTIDEACPNGGFAPSFAALSTNVQAGAYTPFVVSFARSDTDQELQGLSVTLPPGLLADVGSVPLCGEAQANAGTCPESSEVGTVVTTVGPGPDPLQVAGKAYLTGPYNGGPYGLAVVVPAVAGPYNFGTVVVRQSLRINPETAQVTDVSDPFPTIIDGIPLRLRRVDVSLNRPGFTFNPTNCSKLGFDGSIAGSPLGSPRRLAGTVGYATEPGASSSFTAPFQVTNCQTLKFQPKFAVSTAAKTSRAKGASLSVKLTYPKTVQGAEANITRVKVDLPKQLPSRLTTLQKACTAKQFDANPANCPKESKIGYATVHTPILPLPLSGPAIFVSHGGEAFPSLIIVLQGNGVTLDLVGTTFISHAGITSSTFKTVPDAPVGTFELTLPEGKYSALAANLPAKANYSFCGQTLKMPTEFLAQNGTKINESTAISVSGCKKAVKFAKKNKRAEAKKKKK